MTMRMGCDGLKGLERGGATQEEEQDWEEEGGRKEEGVGKGLGKIGVECACGCARVRAHRVHGGW